MKRRVGRYTWREDWLSLKPRARDSPQVRRNSPGRRQGYAVRPRPRVRQPAPRNRHAYFYRRLCRCRNSLLRGDAEDSGGFARRGGRQEHNCAEASRACADRLHGSDVDFSRGELGEQAGGCAGTIFALHKERGLPLAELEFSLLRGGHKRGGIFGNEDEFGFRGGALISPEREQVHTRVTQYSQYAGSFANLVGNAQ